MQNRTIRIEPLAACARPPMFWQIVKKDAIAPGINTMINLVPPTVLGINYVICRSQAQTTTAVRTAITDLTSAMPNPKPQMSAQRASMV